MYKKILLTLIILSSISVYSLHSQNGLELAIYGSGAANFTFPNQYNGEFLRYSNNNHLASYPLKDIDASFNTGVGFSFSGALQFGYYFDFYREFSGLSLLLDAGMSLTRTGFTTIFNNTPGTADTATAQYNDTVTYQSDAITLNAGILIKMHFFKNFAFGVGGGVKLSFFDENIMTSLIRGTELEPFKETTYTSPAPLLINPYVKITAEYNIIFASDWSIRVGIFGDLDLGQFMVPPRSMSAKTFVVTVGASLGVGYLFRLIAE